MRTELFIDKNPDKINPNSKILSVGSAFSNVMADKFQEHSFEIKNNPYGNLYNPISVFNALNVSIKNKPVDQQLITETDGVWNHYDFHYQVGANSKEQLLSQLKEQIQKTHESLKKTDFLILTFGSAFVYKTTKTKQVVANCHHTPTNEFNKQLLSPEEIVEGFRGIYQSLNQVKNIILVVSPVMHLQDSLTLNAVSKSVLRLACHMIMSEFPHVKYFPAYEFLTSDLRDYSNYEDDLITPKKEAVDYIFQKFTEAYTN